MAKLEIKSTRGSLDATVVLDGQDITNYVRALDFRLAAGDEVAKVRVELELIIYDVDLEIDGEIILTEAEDSKEIREVLRKKDEQKEAGKIA